MNVPLFNIKNLPSKSFLLSTLIHACVFNTFIIVWPLLPEAHKPNIIFLGSILQASDILMQTLPPSQQNGKPPSGIFFSAPQKNLFESGLEKPVAKKDYTPQQKKTLKSTYEDTEQEEQGKQEIPLKDITINTHLEPYKPLRLKTHD
ncbi:MAG TPA: hypothetical protein VI749_06335 [Candidatus Omnitrophota bacterium]|nr:hypothetical protein [Candidatus Omnitrophota bacterium]